MIVSVVIPTRFAHSKIIDAVRSVLDQTTKPFEVIVVQDGPQGDSSLKKTVEEMLKKNSFGLELKIEELPKQVGAAAARNVGAGLCKGKYIAFLDDDDFWLPTKVEKQLAVLERDPSVTIASCDFEIILQNRSVQKVQFSQNNPIRSLDTILMTNVLGSCSFCIVRREQFLKCGGFDESLPASQDWDLWLRLCQRFGHPYIVPEVLVRYSDEVRENRISSSATKRVLGYASFLHKHYRHIPASIWPYHALRVIQFGLNDVYGVKSITRVVGPVVRKALKFLTGKQYAK